MKKKMKKKESSAQADLPSRQVIPGPLSRRPEDEQHFEFLRFPRGRSSAA